VEQVSWLDCQRELGRLGLELPSEAQWEYACRAGTGTVWSPGDTLDGLVGFANIADEGARDVWFGGWFFEPGFFDGWDVHCPVGTLLPNAFGLHEMHGNVLEWCADGFDAGFYSSGPAEDPLSPPAGTADRVYRGGSFYYAALHARSAGRYGYPPSFADGNLGVRPARRIDRD
jgi:formylglycine-generating enzyme required for sulfatase activity